MCHGICKRVFSPDRLDQSKFPRVTLRNMVLLMSISA
jgi:hypothetical protein